MNQKLKSLLGVIISLLIGWFIGFIKLPYVNASYDYYLGIISCICFLALSVLIYWIFNRKFIYSKNSFFSFKKLIAPSLFSAALIVFGFLLWKNNQLRIQLNRIETDLDIVKDKNNIEDEKLKLNLLQNLIHSYDSIKSFSKESNKIIDRIVSLSNTLKVYKEWDPINSNYKELSSSRGMFLLSIIQSNIDSISFEKIRNNVSFAYSDLRFQDLKGTDLSGIDLSYADLINSNLEGINLNNANLRGANLQSVNLDKSSLQGATLISSNLKWAKINNADLQKARLDSADLNNATLLNSKLNFVTFIETNMQNSVLNNADMRNSFLLGANFAEVNLSKGILTNITVSRTNLHESNLHEIIIQDNWIEKIKEDDEILIKNIMDKYSIAIDTNSIKDSILHKLVIKN